MQMQLYLTFSPEDENRSVTKLENCIQDTRRWMASNFLKLDDDKTELLALGTPQKLAKLPSGNY